ncbi:MAG: hypothetical protein FWC60_10565, partial [Firmicutes bacterium]|nr:hypothetical protein [Bacillota bacterium]
QNFGKVISQDYSLNMPVLASDNSIISAVEMRKIKGPERLLFVEANDQKAKNEMKKYASENGGVENFVLVEDADKQTKDDMLKYATKNKDKYKISIIGQYLPLEAIEIFSDETKLSNLLDSTGISDIQNVKLVSLYDYGMEIVYFTKGNQEEYAIPFKYNPNFYKSMQNGKTYTIQELIDMISQEF